MVRFWAGLLIATGCHLLLFVVPVYHQPEELPQPLQTNAISVRFNPLKPVPPQKEVEAIPAPPEPIAQPEKKQIEKPQPPKQQPVPPKPKPIPPKPKPVPPKPKPLKIKKIKKATVKPPKPTPPLKPEIPKEKPVAKLQPKLAEAPTAKTQTPTPTTAKTATRAPVVNKAPPKIRKAYPKNEGNPPPKYPTLARRRGWEGVVQLLVLVLENGRVGDISVAKSSGHPLLDKAALEAVAQYQFVPGMQGNEPITMQVQVPVHFRLQTSN